MHYPLTFGLVCSALLLQESNWTNYNVILKKSIRYTLNFT